MIKCTHFKSFEKGCLQGFATLEIDKWGAEIKGCTLNMKDGKRWVSLPRKEYEVDGEKKYQPIVRLLERSHQDTFSEQAKEAIDLYCSQSVSK